MTEEQEQGPPMGGQREATAPPAPYMFHPDLEKYRSLICNTGGNEVEELMNRLRREPNLISTNLPVYVLAVAVHSQMILLARLQADGFLA